jgi:hypothetical protein
MANGKKRRFVKRRVIDISSSILYLLGLSGIIPFALSIDINSRLENLSLAPVYIIVISLLLMASGIYIQYKFLRDKKIGRTIASIGRMTLIPGLAIILFMIFGTEFLINFVEKMFNPTGAQVLSEYINTTVPRVLFIGIFYASVGTALFFLGRQIKE